MSETITWVEPDDTATDLVVANGVQIQPGVAGRFMPPVTLFEAPLPSGQGSAFRGLRNPPREIPIPLAFLADDAAELRALLRQWVNRFAPDRGAGRLQITDHEGQQREIVCRYNGGLEIVESGEHVGGAQPAVAIFRALDPYWQDVDDTDEVFTIAGTPVDFFPIPNATSGSFVTLSVSTVSATPLVVNDGDVDAWPVWQLLGPGDGLILMENESTGKVLELTQAIAEGESVTIDTRPGRKTVTLDDGTNLYPELSDDSSLWPLQPGGNQLSIQVDGATEATQVLLSYRRRWRTA